MKKWLCMLMFAVLLSACNNNPEPPPQGENGGDISEQENVDQNGNDMDETDEDANINSDGPDNMDFIEDADDMNHEDDDEQQ